jgi:hypothetical protein
MTKDLDYALKERQHHGWELATVEATLGCLTKRCGWQSGSGFFGDRGTVTKQGIGDGVIGS